jgi:molybdopterin-binding protein
MEISARNQLRGTVKAVTTDSLMAEVVVDIGGQEIVSTITRASADRLKLKAGDTVVAIIKASEVLIAK